MKPRTRSDRKNEYPWSGAVKCGTCGRSFHGHASGLVRRKRLSDGTVRDYINAKPVRYYHCTLCNYSINADRLETWMRGLLAQMHADPTLLTTLAGDTQESVPLTKQLIAKLESETRPDVVSEQRRATWDLARQSASGALFLEEELSRINREQAGRVERLEELRKRLTAESARKRTTLNATKLLERFWDIFDSATYDERRELAEAIVAAVGPITATRSGLEYKTLD